jgi:hypothetical protein
MAFSPVAGVPAVARSATLSTQRLRRPPSLKLRRAAFAQSQVFWSSNAGVPAVAQVLSCGLERRLVDDTGLEPVTSSMSRKRSSQLSSSSLATQRILLAGWGAVNTRPRNGRALRMSVRLCLPNSRWPAASWSRRSAGATHPGSSWPNQPPRVLRPNLRRRAGAW